MEKINKIDKLSARLIKKKRKKTQINKIKHERGEIKVDITEIPRIVIEYCSYMPTNWTTWKKWTNF